MNHPYAQYAINIHEIDPSSPLTTFPFLTFPGGEGIIDSIRIVVSPITATNVTINVGFYDSSNVYRTLFRGSSATPTELTVPMPLRSSAVNVMRYGIINSSAATVYLVAHYFYIYV